MNHAARAVLCQLATGPTEVAALTAAVGTEVPDVHRAIAQLDEAGIVTISDDHVEVHPDCQYDERGIDRVIPEWYRLTYRDQVDSTNALASQLGGPRPPELGLVIAGEQTAGRGRYDREWHSPTGGIWASVIDRRPRVPTAAWHDQLAMTVAVTDLTSQVGLPTRLKWPNDVVTEDGTKLAGVLVEGVASGGTVHQSVCGVGLNADIDQDRLPPEATSLRAHLSRIDPVALIGYLLASFDRRRATPHETRATWRRRSHTIGNEVTVTTPDGEVTGSAIELGESGELVIEGEAGLTRIPPDRCQQLRYSSD